MQASDQGVHLLSGMRTRLPPGRGGIILSHLFPGTGAIIDAVSIVEPTICGVPGNSGPVRRILNRRVMKLCW